MGTFDFSKFQLYNPKFKTKTTDPLLNAVNQMSTSATAQSSAASTSLTPAAKSTYDWNQSLAAPTGLQTGTQKGTTATTSLSSPAASPPAPGVTVASPEGNMNSGTGTGTATTTTDIFTYDPGAISQGNWTNYIASSRTNFLNVLQSKGGLSAGYGNAIADWMLANNLTAPSMEQLKSILSSNSNFSFNGTDEQFRISFQQALDVATDWSKELGEKQSEYGVSTSGDQYVNTINDLIKNFSTQWGDKSKVEAFTSEWTDKFGEAFGDLGDFNSTDFLSNFIKNFGLDKIITNQVDWGDYGFENYSPDFLKQFLDSGSTIPGFDSTTGETDVSNEQSFIQFLMNTAKEMLPSLGEVDFTDDSGILDKATQERFTAAMQLLSQPGMTKQEFETQVSGVMEPLRKSAELQKRSITAETGMRLAGNSTRSVVLNRAVDRDTQMQEAVVRGDLTKADIEMRNQNYQLGVQELGKLSQDQVAAITAKLNVQTTKEGQVLDFLAQVGQIAVGSKETEYSHSENQMKLAQDAWRTQSELTLNKELGMAGLSLDLYKTDTGYDIEKVQTALDLAIKNRQITSTEAIAQANSAIEQYKLAQSFANMDMNQLATMADLAAKAQEGDRQAWGQYQSLLLEEQLKNRGLDIEQSKATAELVYGMWQTDKQTALTMWITKYNGQLQKELKQMELDASYKSPWIDALDSFLGGAGSFIGLFKGGSDTSKNTNA